MQIPFGRRDGAEILINLILPDRLSVSPGGSLESCGPERDSQTSNAVVLDGLESY